MSETKGERFERRRGGRGRKRGVEGRERERETETETEREREVDGVDEQVDREIQQVWKEGEWR